MSHKLQDEVEEVIHGAEEVIHEAGEVLHDVLEGLSEEELISHSEHKSFEHGVCCSEILPSAWLFCCF